MIRQTVWWLLVGIAQCFAVESVKAQSTLAERNEILFHKLEQERGLSDEQVRRIREIFARSGFIGQGNPAISQHPVTEAQCATMASQQGIQFENPRFGKICGARFMAPLYNSKTGSADRASACIDQFEFPNLPCTYPVVWVKAKEAAEICEAEGERLCDAHEWEGACAGSLEAPDYDFEMAKGVPRESPLRACALHITPNVKRTSPGAMALSTEPAYAPRAASRLPGVPAEAGSYAAQIPIPRAAFRLATARSTSTTSTAMRPNI